MRGIHSRAIKRTEGFKRRVKAGIERRQSQGLPFGAPRKHPDRWFECKNCGKEFRDTTGKKTRIACGQECALKLRHKDLVKIRNPEEIRELYLSGKSTVEIGEIFSVVPKTIRDTLDKLNCPRRKRGEKIRTGCKVEGCPEPIHLIWHAKNQCHYGTYCKDHYDRKKSTWRRHHEAKRKDRIV